MISMKDDKGLMKNWQIYENYNTYKVSLKKKKPATVKCGVGKLQREKAVQNEIAEHPAFSDGQQQS